MYHIKNDKRSLLSSRLIYEALCELMNRKQIEDIKVTEIVEMAQIGRATFYRNYDTIMDILIYQSDKVFEGLMSSLIDYHNEHQVNRSSEFLIPFLNYFDEHTEIVELIIKANRVDVLNNSLSALLRRMYSAYADSVEGNDKIWDYFVAIRSGITTSILVQWIKNGKDMCPNELGQLIYRQMGMQYNIEDYFNTYNDK